MMGMGRAGVHRRGDSCSSLRSEDGREGGMSDPGPRPVFFLHGVGLGMVSFSALTQALWESFTRLFWLSHNVVSRKVLLETCRDHRAIYPRLSGFVCM